MERSRRSSCSTRTSGLGHYELKMQEGSKQKPAKSTRVRAARKTENTHGTGYCEISDFRLRGETGPSSTCSSGILLNKPNKFN